MSILSYKSWKNKSKIKNKIKIEKITKNGIENKLENEIIQVDILHLITHS